MKFLFTCSGPRRSTEACLALPRPTNVGGLSRGFLVDYQCLSPMNCGGKVIYLACAIFIWMENLTNIFIKEKVICALIYAHCVVCTQVHDNNKNMLYWKATNIPILGCYLHNPAYNYASGRLLYGFPPRLPSHGFPSPRRTTRGGAVRHWPRVPRRRPGLEDHAWDALGPCGTL